MADGLSSLRRTSVRPLTAAVWGRRYAKDGLLQRYSVCQSKRMQVMAQSVTGKYWRRKLVNDYTSPIVWLLGLIVVLAVVVVAVWIVDVLVQLARRSIFKKQYLKKQDK